MGSVGVSVWGGAVCPEKAKIRPLASVSLCVFGGVVKKDTVGITRLAVVSLGAIFQQLHAGGVGYGIGINVSVFVMSSSTQLVWFLKSGIM